MGALFSLYRRLFGGDDETNVSFGEASENSLGLSQEEKNRLLSRLDSNEKEIGDLKEKLNKITKELDKRIEENENKISFLEEVVDSIDERGSTLNTVLNRVKAEIDDIKRSRYEEVLAPPLKKLSECDFHNMS